jgi:hypothetical protein
MDDESGDRVAPAPGDGARRRWPVSGMLSSVLGILSSSRVAAQGDTATAGSGGYATASAGGGGVVVGDINSGGNTGNAVGVGDTSGEVWVDGGDVANSTSVGITADGGTAIADASGGNYNMAIGGGFVS